MISGVETFASGIFGTHMWRPQGERAGASPPPGSVYHIFSQGYDQGEFSLCILFIYFILSYVFCKFISGVDFY